MYNPKMIEEFNEWLNDNYDSFKCGDLEYCADEILRTLDVEIYEKMLTRYIARHNIFAEHGNIRDEDGWILDPQPDEEF